MTVPTLPSVRHDELGDPGRFGNRVTGCAELENAGRFQDRHRGRWRSRSGSSWFSAERDARRLRDRSRRQGRDDEGDRRGRPGIERAKLGDDLARRPCPVVPWLEVDESKTRPLASGRVRTTFVAGFGPVFSTVAVKSSLVRSDDGRRLRDKAARPG